MMKQKLQLICVIACAIAAVGCGSSGLTVTGNTAAASGTSPPVTTPPVTTPPVTTPPPSTPPPVAGILAFSASSYSIAQNAGNLTVTVGRSGGSSGAVTIGYATTDGSAKAGTDYTAASGMLSWTANDAAAKTFSIPVSNATAFTGTKNFSISLASPSGGATAGSPNSATATIAGDGVAASPGAVELAASAYTVAQSAGALTVSINRSGGSSGAASVHYATSDGSATAGTNYTAASGTVSWSSGDASAKTFSITIAGSPAFSGTKTLTVTLSSATGATLGSPVNSTASITGAGVVATSGLSVRVQGNHLIDAQGNPLQLRGVNVSGLEFTAVQGWSPADPFGGQTPSWSAIKAWKANAVRLPLNEDSWLGRHCVDAKTGAARAADPGGNYVATVNSAVNAATAAGFYVILDLHLAAPGNYCAMIQSPMADADNSVAFWTSVATAFKAMPNVLFELFNEPFVTQDSHFSAGGNDIVGWEYLLLGTGGAAFSGFNEGDLSGSTDNVSFAWQGASMQSLLNAIRATGATNVVVAGGLYYSGSLATWLLDHPVDPLNQIAAAWHAYPTFGAAFGTPAAANPNFYPQIYTEAQAILDAGLPILITETGDQCSQGTPNSPEVTNVTTWADAHAVSVFGWAWDTWTSPGATSCSDVLIEDATGTPTPGYGVVFHDWMVNHP
ncbi:MAG TPA: cellulase family glycosylhydrolase [Steroidobacteraceae bacterium]|nr:cellulase family glycosylhydrolase [Steroidobacteraceae bacterium]